MSLETLVQGYGLRGIVAGTVLEGDTVAFLGGVLAHRGLLSFAAVVGAVVLGAVLVDNGVFLMGRYAGQRAFVQRQLARGPVRLLRARLDRHPVAVILGFRFVWGMTTLGALMLGASPLNWPRFAVLDLLACTLWALVFCALGFGAGQAIRSVFGHLDLHLHLGLAVAIFLTAAGLIALWHHRKRKHGGRRQ
ncbi:VTT domain-containing protein [Sedimentitalea sp. JM2-8]|uniref:VTT domain-containing protein n=1 Tax=Sedimentitalea xiamensis TaxID=3050037 RepID=A0ABT7FEM7_9RHOB|nr:VTT domain-containing protein [Sedimentitalea xiamensis]MDK3073582.1 VTT domain-containing protein [Sedimentitalea xiamensis]